MSTQHELQKLIQDQQRILIRLGEIYGFVNPKEFQATTLRLLAQFEHLQAEFLRTAALYMGEG